MVTHQDLHALAVFMVENHGKKALHLANRAVDELDAIQETESADAWRCLRSVVEDMLAGRLSVALKPALN